MLTQDLLGIWIVRSFYLQDIETGERSQPWGPRPGGTLVFTPSGRMFAIITADARQPPETEAAQAHAYRNMLSYSGPFRIDPPNSLVTTVDISWHAPWLGTEQVRFIEFRDDILVLTSAPLAMPTQAGEPNHVFAVVEWTREA